jgi:hypothetical protein
MKSEKVTVTYIDNLNFILFFILYLNCVRSDYADYK